MAKKRSRVGTARVLGLRGSVPGLEPRRRALGFFFLGCFFLAPPLWRSAAESAWSARSLSSSKARSRGETQPAAVSRERRRAASLWLRSGGAYIANGRAATNMQKRKRSVLEV